MVGSVGPMEIGIVLVVALLVFGPRKLPELGGSLGRSIREFTRSVAGHGDGMAPLPETAHGAGEAVASEPRKVAMSGAADSA